VLRRGPYSLVVGLDAVRALNPKMLPDGYEEVVLQRRALGGYCPGSVTVPQPPAAGMMGRAIAESAKRGGLDVIDRVEVLLVCSSGGHLLQLFSLSPAWGGLARAWVTFDKSDARSLLDEERLYVAYGPTNRSVRNLLRNLGLAWRVVRRTRPRVLVTTGAGVAVPFAYLARLHGAKVVYIESFTRIDSISLSCRMIRPIADRVYVQWPDTLRHVRAATYVGSVLSDEMPV
jgi:beta-1,4-N-acetylglucosaminyltransferase